MKYITSTMDYIRSNVKLAMCIILALFIGMILGMHIAMFKPHIDEFLADYQQAKESLIRARN